MIVVVEQVGHQPRSEVYAMSIDELIWHHHEHIDLFNFIRGKDPTAT